MKSREDLVLKEQRSVSFEQAVIHIEREDLLDVIRHPNEAIYPYQKVLVIGMQDYVYPVLCVEKGEERFLYDHSEPSAHPPRGDKAVQPT